jgi:hypothetical protein
MWHPSEIYLNGQHDDGKGNRGGAAGESQIPHLP